MNNIKAKLRFKSFKSSANTPNSKQQGLGYELKCFIFKTVSLFSVFAVMSSVFAGAEPANNKQSSNSAGLMEYHSSKSYKDYIASKGSAPAGTDSIKLGKDNISESQNIRLEENFENYPGFSIITEDTGFVEYSFEISNSGRYQIDLTYFPIQGKGSNIIRNFLIDNTVLYDEIRELDFSRAWTDAEKIAKDSNGNHIRPAQKELPRWINTSIKDAKGYFTDPLQIFFEAGKHTLRIESVREPMAIGDIMIIPPKETASYEAMLSEYESKGFSDGGNYITDIQGEDAFLKSDSSIYPIYDRTSPDTVPNSASNIYLNTIGGTKWQTPNQWIVWEINDVPADGFYNIAIKARQNILSGAYSTRTLKINGEIPFEEAKDIRFYYNSSFEAVHLGGEEGVYKFPLKKGKNEITLEITLGKLSALLMEVSSAIEKLNNAYMKILVITGPSPDLNRDYQFKTRVPEALELLEIQRNKLEEVYKRYVKETNQNGQQAQTLKKAYMLLESFSRNPDTIASRFNELESTINDLGVWLNTSSQQPLEIDYITVASPDKEIKIKKLPFISKIWFGIKQLVASFFHDYDVVGNKDEDLKNVLVWVGNGATGGRDQAQVLQRMISGSNFKENSISVQIQLVSMGALLPATLSGKGPDVALTVASSDPVNYAIRNGVVDIGKFSDYEEIAQRFMPSALTPFAFNGGVYALPETQTFYMMFYRKDILSELGVEVPQTWDDVRNLLPVLQKKNLSFGFPQVIGESVGIGFSAFSMFMYQQGGDLYNESGSKSELDSRAGVDAFELWTQLYTSYNLPQQYDFMNRFRSGAIPIGIADYTLYNTLQVFAPEIKGHWNMIPVPGTKTADGAINNSVTGAVTGSIIMKNTKNPEAAWAFLKWWTSASVQGDFGIELESILGAAGRYSPANIEALQRIPWAKKDLDSILKQLQNVKGIREVPGSYMTARFVDFAFRDVVNSGVDPDEAIRDAVKQINTEIALRRKEFKLPAESGS